MIYVIILKDEMQSPTRSVCFFVKVSVACLQNQRSFRSQKMADFRSCSAFIRWPFGRPIKIHMSRPVFRGFCRNSKWRTVWHLTAMGIVLTCTCMTIYIFEAPKIRSPKFEWILCDRFSWETEFQIQYLQKERRVQAKHVNKNFCQRPLQGSKAASVLNLKFNTRLSQNIQTLYIATAIEFSCTLFLFLL